MTNDELRTKLWDVEKELNDLRLASSPDTGLQLTVQELLREREVSYRNLLAAFLKLQETNRLIKPYECQTCGHYHFGEPLTTCVGEQKNGSG